MVKKLIKKLINIILGNWYRFTQQHRNEKRINICKGCDQMKHLPLYGDYCLICGCPIESKTPIADEECPLEKW